MNWLEHTLSPALVRALGWTLVHSLWQGAVVALALAGLLLLLRRHRATVRYHVATVALLVLLALAAVTFARHYWASFADPEVAAAQPLGAAETPAAAASPLLLGPAAATPRGSLQAWLTYFEQNLPVLVAAWLLGLLAMTLRLLGGLAYVQRLRHYRVLPLAEAWQQRLAALAARAGVARPVQLLESALVRAPLVVGHLRPAILLPLGTVAGLSPVYLEAVLAHELAHVARRDYLLNLVQAVAETLFFYHPAVWFISACLRSERENCCDDAATALVDGNPLTLARALASLAELSLEPAATPRLALSALGPDGSLLGRIRRLVQGRGTPTFSEGFMAACVVLGGLVLLSTAVALAGPRTTLEEPAQPGALGRLPFLAQDDTTRKATTTPAPAATPAPLMPKQPAAVEQQEKVAVDVADNATTPADDDKKRKAKRSRTERVMVINDNNRRGPRRGGAGTVIIEKDKKGRLTDLYVNGQRVEAAGKDKKAARTEIIQLAPDGPARNNGVFFGDDFARSFQFETIPGWTEADKERLRQQVRVQVGRGRRYTYLKPSNRRYSFEFDGRKLVEPDYDNIIDRALEEAERSLQEAERNAKTNEARQQIQEERVRMRERMQERREELCHETEDLRHDIEDAQRDAEEARRDAEDERRHDAEDARRDAEEARRDADEARRDAEREERSGLQDALVSEMLRDKLITDRRNFSFSLRSGGLTVNGKKQPAATLSKYLKLYEQHAGKKMGANNSFSVSESHSGHGDGPRMPRPPQPPRPPQTPRAPRLAPLAPLPPVAPRGPRFNSTQIRDELRKDGLIGKDDRSYQLQLNAEGLVVNGQRQPEQMAVKYRKLMGHDDGKPHNLQISIDE